MTAPALHASPLAVFVPSAVRFAEIADLWWRTAPAWAIQLGLLGALVLVVDRLLPRGGWLEVRSLLWSLVLVRAILPPALGAPWIVVPWIGARLTDASTFLSPVSGTTGAIGLGAVATTSPAAATGWVRWAIAAVPAAWAAGAAILAAALIHAHLRRVACLRRASRPTDPLLRQSIAAHAAALGLRRAPATLTSAAVAVPQLIGATRPILVLPVGMEQTPRAERDAALVHELVHLRRRDPLRAALQLVLVVPLWIHPIPWLALRRLAELRECACDARAAAHLGDTEGYRRSLAWWGRVALGARAPIGGPALLRRRHPLLARLDRLARLGSDAHRNEPAGWRRSAALAATVTLAACIPAIHPPAPLALPDPAVPGCLAERYVVLAALARRQAAEAASGGDLRTARETHPRHDAEGGAGAARSEHPPEPSRPTPEDLR